MFNPTQKRLEVKTLVDIPADTDLDLYDYIIPQFGTELEGPFYDEETLDAWGFRDDEDGWCYYSVSAWEVIPAGTTLCYFEVEGSGDISIAIRVYVSYRLEYDYLEVNEFFNTAVAARCCESCVQEYAGKPGHVLGESTIGIMDALEILKSLAGIPNKIDDCANALAASLITEASQTAATPAPGIMDALEILKKLAGIDGQLTIDN